MWEVKAKAGDVEGSADAATRARSLSVPLLHPPRLSLRYPTK